MYDYIALEAITVFADIASNVSGHYSIHGCLSNAVDLFAAIGYAVVELFVSFQKIIS